MTHRRHGECPARGAGVAYRVDEATDALLHLVGKELVEPGGAKLVHKIGRLIHA